MYPLITLQNGGAQCALCPEIGGSMVYWRIDGQDMLRAADDEAMNSGDPTRFASFPLVPFSNRIAGGKFDWRGKTIEIDHNLPTEPHAIHGVGWQRPWAVSQQSDAQCVLTLNHSANSQWPWPFLAKQTFILGKNILEVQLEAMNSGDKPAPLAFGFHPFFDRENATLAFHSNHIFLADDNGLPTNRIAPQGEFDFSKGEYVADRCIDNCYNGWDGETRIVWQNRPFGLVLNADMNAAVVYIPRGEDMFCFEPVPHINNALNRPDDDPAMPIIAPGDSYSAKVIMTATSQQS